MAFFPGGAAPADDPPDFVGEALVKCKDFQEQELDVPDVLLRDGDGPVKISDLPVRPFEVRHAARHIIDIMIDVREPLALDEIANTLRENRWGDLPAILRPQQVPDQAIGVRMTLAVLKNENNVGFNIVKIFEFDKLPADAARAMVHGEAMMMRYLSPQPQLAKRVFKYLFQHLGGLQLTWTRYVHPEEDDDDKKIDAGFDYIEKTAPRDTTGLNVLRWIEKSIKKDTPVKGWNASLLEKCVSRLAAGGNLAKIRKDYPLTLRDINPEFLRYVLGPIIPKLLKNSIIFLGENNSGQTPTAIIVSFLMAR